jgi:hypothetical protein
MSRLFSALASLAVGFWLAAILGQPMIGVSVGVLTLLLFELPRSAAEKRRLHLIANAQTLRLQDANAQIARLDYHIQLQSNELGMALSEIERRDSVGAPEARKLIESQRATLAAQALAMDEAKQLIEAQEKMGTQFENRTEDARKRWEDMVEKMDRVLQIQTRQAETAQQHLADESGHLSEAFAENSREMQRTMSDLLRQLALEPRTSHVSVQDSVLMGDPRNPPVDAARIVVGPHLSTRHSRKPPKVPKVRLKARALPGDDPSGRWVEAFNEDLV